MSTTIRTQGGCVGVACGSPVGDVLLSCFAHNGAGMTLRLTSEEAASVAAELLSRAAAGLPASAGLPPLPPKSFAALLTTPCARCGCLATSHPVPPAPHASDSGSVAWWGCPAWQGPLGPRDPAGG